MEGPLILVLVKFFLKFFAYCCSILSIPITIYSIIVNKILKFDTTNNPGGHFLIFIPRIILVIPFPFSFPLLAYLYGYLVDFAINNGKVYVPYVIAIGFLVVIIIGFWFTRSMSFLKDSIDQMKVKGSDSYFKGLGEALLDIGATFSFFISLVTVIRIPSMLLSVIYRDEFVNHKKIRNNLYRHLFLIPFDLICLPCLLIVLVTGIRIKPLFNKISNDYNTTWKKLFNLQLRLLIIKNLIILILEFFVMLLCVVFLISPWRIKVAIEKVKNEDKQVRKFGSLFLQQMNGLLDVMVIICCLPLLISFYRLPYAIRKIFEGTTASSRRKEALFQTFFVFFDLFLILFSIVIICTLYRVPRTVKKIINRPTRYWEYIGIQFLKIFRDLPFLFMGLFVVCLIWRAPFMLTQVFKESKRSKCRKIVTKHFCWIFIDILDIPFVLSSLIILFTFWRAYSFICGFVMMDTRKKQRVFVIKQIFYWLMDIPSFLALIFITVTVYRLPKTFKLLRLYFKHNDYISKFKPDSVSSQKEITINRISTPAVASIYDEDNPPPPSDYNEDNPLPQTANIKSNNSSNNSKDSKEIEEIKNFTSWRQIVFKQFLLCIIDIPFPILTLLTLWRLPILIKRFKEIDDPIRKYTLRRLLILRYVLLTFLDILCIIPAIFILVTIWRVPSFIKLIKQYQRGDNEHKMFGLLFWNTLVDIPFVLMGLVILPVPWRGAFLIRTLIKNENQEIKTDKDARAMAAKYLGATLLDLLMLIMFCFIGCTMWRIKSFIKMYKEEIVKERVSLKFRVTLTLFYCTVVTSVIIFIDVFKTFQVLVIVLFIKQVKPLYQAVQRVKTENPNWTLEDFLDIISYYFLVTLMDIPHVFMIPIKLLGFPFLPIHLYLKKRSSENNANTTMSFLNYPIYFLHELSVDCMNYYGFDKFFIINVFGILLIAVNELALIVVLFNCIYMFIVTLGCPLWAETRKKYGWTYLGKAQGPMMILEYITVILQSLLFPVFVLIQIAILLLPTLLSLGLYPSPTLGFVEYWKDFFSERSFWHEASSFSSGIWVAQAFWALVCFASWQITYKVSKRYFTIFSPWKSYYWLVKKVFHGKLWYCYTLILITGTRICYKLRRACLIGEILMFPLFIIWTCWPFIIPIATKIYYIFIGSGIITLGLFVIAYKIIKENWTDNRKSMDFTPIVSLSNVICELPESGGIIFTFNGSSSNRNNYSTMPTIVDARLSLESEKLWDTIGKVVGSTKVRAALMVVGYPISLCPMFFNVDEFNNQQDKSNLIYSIKIGIEGSKPLIKKKVLTKIINKLREVDDSPFDFVIEYGKKDFGWQKHGVICKFTTTLQNLLENNIVIDNQPISGNNYNNYGDYNISSPIPKSKEYNSSPSSSPTLKPLSTGLRADKPTGLKTVSFNEPSTDQLPNVVSDEVSPDILLEDDDGYENYNPEDFENQETEEVEDQDVDNQQPPTPPQQPITILNDMSNYISDDQMNEEFFRSLDTRDKSNNV